MCLRAPTLNLHQLNSVCSRAQPFEAAQSRAQPLNAAQLRSNACPAGVQTNCRWRLRVPAVDMRSRTRREQPLNTARSRSTPPRAAQRRSKPDTATQGVTSRLHPLPGGSGDMLHAMSSGWRARYVKPASAMRSRAARLHDNAVCALAASRQLAAPLAGNAQQVCSSRAGWSPRNKRGLRHASWAAPVRCCKVAGLGPT